MGRIAALDQASHMGRLVGALVAPAVHKAVVHGTPVVHKAGVIASRTASKAGQGRARAGIGSQRGWGRGSIDREGVSTRYGHRRRLDHRGPANNSMTCEATPRPGAPSPLHTIHVKRAIAPVRPFRLRQNIFSLAKGRSAATQKDDDHFTTRGNSKQQGQMGRRHRRRGHRRPRLHARCRGLQDARSPRRYRNDPRRVARRIEFPRQHCANGRLEAESSRGAGPPPLGRRIEHGCFLMATCLACETKFVSRPRGKAQRYCSTTCRRKAQNGRVRPPKTAVSTLPPDAVTPNVLTRPAPALSKPTPPLNVEWLSVFL